jgi:hypothetical protein
VRLLSALAVALAGCAAETARTVPDGYARIALACADGQADVTVDGVPAGKAQDYASSGGRLLVRPGRHRIELRAASGERAVREALVGPGDDVSFSVQLGGSQ